MVIRMPTLLSIGGVGVSGETIAASQDTLRRMWFWCYGYWRYLFQVWRCRRSVGPGSDEFDSTTDIFSKISRGLTVEF